MVTGNHAVYYQALLFTSGVKEQSENSQRKTHNVTIHTMLLNSQYRLIKKSKSWRLTKSLHQMKHDYDGKQPTNAEKINKLVVGITSNPFHGEFKI